MPRESVDTRARRLLIEHRVRLTRLLGDTVSAEVRGTGAIHSVHHSIDTGWTCSCEAGQYRRRCSHVLAVQHVTVPDDGDRRP